MAVQEDSLLAAGRGQEDSLPGHSRPRGLRHLLHKLLLGHRPPPPGVLLPTQPLQHTV